MRRNKSFLHMISLFFICISFTWIFMSQEVSANLKVDTERPVTIKVNYKIGGTAIPDVEFSLYHVANVLEHGEMELTDQFKDYRIEMDDLNEENAVVEAEVLAAYIKRDQLKPIDSGKTNENGILQFPTEDKKIYSGLYLIIGADHKLEDQLYDTLPLLVYMPIYYGSNDFIYEIELAPKYRMKEEVTEITVVKVWDDKTTKYRPSQIEAQLIDGKTDKVRDTVVLNDNNNWRYTWTNLPVSDWEVIEKEVPEHYTVSIERDENVVVIKNTSTKKPPESDKPENPEDPENPEEPKTPEQPSEKLPQTGTYWWPVPILAMTGFLLIAIGISWWRHEE